MMYYLTLIYEYIVYHFTYHGCIIIIHFNFNRVSPFNQRLLSRGPAQHASQYYTIYSPNITVASIIIMLSLYFILWNILQICGVPQELSVLVLQLYTDTCSAVRLACSLSEKFTIESGVKQ